MGADCHSTNEGDEMKKTYQIVVVSTWSEVYFIEADSESDAEDRIDEGEGYSVKTRCLESDIVSTQLWDSASE
jgi:hypothetical protein